MSDAAHDSRERSIVYTSGKTYLGKKDARFSKQLQEIVCSSCSIPGNCNGCSFYGEENEFFEPNKQKGGN